MLWEPEPQASASITFSSSPKLSRVLETRTTCFLFRLENTTTRKIKTICQRQKLVLLLCFHRIIRARLLTNQRAYFLRTVFYICITLNSISYVPGFGVGAGVGTKKGQKIVQEYQYLKQ